MDDTLLAPLLTAIAEENDEAAESAIIDLSERNGSACSPLLALSQSADADQRWWAVRGLAALAETDEASRAAVMPAIVDALSDADDAVRCVAALALGQLQATSTIPSLILLLTDPSGWVRGAAADGLALMGEAAVPALGEALYDPRDGVRVRAAYALRKICSPKSAGWLFPALNDPNHLVHAYAYETLDQMGLLTTVLVR
jgi:HEAT repeat protein